MLALEARAMKDDVLLGDTPKAARRRHRVQGVETSGRLWKHSGLSDIDGLVSQHQIEEFFVFTLVRNPWDRLVSYYHWLRLQSFDHPAVLVAQAKTFGQFLRDAGIAASLKNHPYGRYVRDMGGVERCNLFIRLEHLSHDIAGLEAHLGFSLGVIPHENRSGRAADYREYYEGSDADIVAEICAEDIARFDYRYDR